MLSPKAEFSPLLMSLKNLLRPGCSGPVLPVLWELGPWSHKVLVLVLERRLGCPAMGSLLIHSRRGGRDGAEGGMIFRDTVSMVAFINDGF